MNAVAKRLRPKCSMSPAPQARPDAPLYVTRPPQARPDAPLPVGFSQVRATQAYLRSVEEPEREKPRRARGSAAGRRHE